MSNLFDSLRDRLTYARAYRGVVHSLSALTPRELDDIGVDCVASTAHESATRVVQASRVRRFQKRTARENAALCNISVARRSSNEFYGIGQG